MRTPAKRPLLVGLLFLGLLFSLPGCKSGFSPPSMDWLSWGKKKPSPTALSSAIPKKPSTTTLPSPAATTGAAGQGMGTMGGFASAPATSPSATYGRSPSNPSGYYTGPYGTGQSMPSSTASMPSGYPSSGYPGGTAPYGGAANPGNPSPYQAMGP